MEGERKFNRKISSQRGKAKSVDCSLMRGKYEEMRENKKHIFRAWREEGNSIVKYPLKGEKAESVDPQLSSS